MAPYINSAMIRKLPIVLITIASTGDSDRYRIGAYLFAASQSPLPAIEDLANVGRIMPTSSRDR